VQPALLLATLTLSMGLSLAISRIFLVAFSPDDAQPPVVRLLLAPGGLRDCPVLDLVLTPALAQSHAATLVIQLLLH